MVRDLFAGMDVTWHHLDAAEIERASGFTAELQRLWRSRGVLPKKTGTRVRYTSHEAAMFSLARVLRARGCSQAEALELGERYKPLVLHLAMMNADGVVEVVGTSAFVEAALRSMEETDDLFSHISGWDRSESGMLFVSEDDMPFQLKDEVPDWAYQDGPVHYTAINLVTLARNFADRLARPLVLIQERRDDSQVIPSIRRLFNPANRQLMR